MTNIMCDTKLEHPDKCQQPLSYEQLWGDPQAEPQEANQPDISAAPGCSNGRNQGRDQGGYKTEQGKVDGTSQPAALPADIVLNKFY